jgi:hypothetical protein
VFYVVQEINEAYLNNEALNDVDVHDPTRHRMDAPLQLPFPLGTTRVTYFAFQVRRRALPPLPTPPPPLPPLPHV